ncbi:hypothetical protein RFI_02509 [Reticulomyxa filosa]|uniref:SPRY domain-containing protein n=1 Tax=Reticulomyxa filosa TaxID=46433 RepID=X6P8Q5_RETFI|nr:hypothetical protein RFI_02509 [Reticulomyxa filosa]|eukprot:ETO34581.1 hypothetical protein RFI_02509 [Reticulomyxa filosa]
MSKEGVTRLDRWACGSSDVTLEGQEATATQKKLSNIYGEAIVAAGRAEWDIKLEFEGYGGIVVGLWRHNLADKNNLEQLPLDNEQFVNFENGYGFSNKTGEFIENKERKNYSQTPWKRGSVLTLHLDMTSQTLTYSVDGKQLGPAKDGLPRGAYRLAAKLQFQEQKLNILRFWTSLEGIVVVFIVYNGVVQVPNGVKEPSATKEQGNNEESNKPTESSTDGDVQKEVIDNNNASQVEVTKRKMIQIQLQLSIHL